MYDSHNLIENLKNILSFKDFKRLSSCFSVPIKGENSIENLISCSKGVNLAYIGLILPSECPNPIQFRYSPPRSDPIFSIGFLLALSR